MGLRWAYRSTKARRELGWAPGHHEEALRRTVDWYREREGEGLRPPGSRQRADLRLTGALLRGAARAGGRLGR